MTHDGRLDLDRSAPFVLASGADGVWVVGRDGVALHDPELGVPISTAATDAVSDVLSATIIDEDVAPVAPMAIGDGLMVCLGSTVSLADPRARLRRVLTPEPADVAAVDGAGRSWVGRIGSAWLAEIDDAGSHHIHRLDAPLIALDADQRGAWWIEAGTDVMHNGDRSIAIPPVDARTRLAAAAGSIWVTHGESVTMVRSHDGSLGPAMRFPVAFVEHLVDVSGALVGGTTTDRVVVMNPAADDGPRMVDLGSPMTITSIAGARGVAWIAAGDGDVWALPV